MDRRLLRVRSTDAVRREMRACTANQLTKKAIAREKPGQPARPLVQRTSVRETSAMRFASEIIALRLSATSANFPGISYAHLPLADILTLPVIMLVEGLNIGKSPIPSVHFQLIW